MESCTSTAHRDRIQRQASDPRFKAMRGSRKTPLLSSNNHGQTLINALPSNTNVGGVSGVRTLLAKKKKEERERKRERGGAEEGRGRAKGG